MTEAVAVNPFSTWCLHVACNTAQSYSITCDKNVSCLLTMAILIINTK